MTQVIRAKRAEHTHRSRLKCSMKASNNRRVNLKRKRYHWVQRPLRLVLKTLTYFLTNNQQKNHTPLTLF